MKGGKDEGKPMDPLFPRLRISDADKGGPRAPPRNKMALCEQYNLPSQSPRFNSGSMAMLPIWPSNGHSSNIPQASSSHVVGPQQKVLPTFCSLPGSSHLGERHRSYDSTGVNLNTSLTKSEPRTTNYRNPSASRNSMATNEECNSLQPHGFDNRYTKRSGDENDLSSPSSVEVGMSSGNLQPHLEEEKLTTHKNSKLFQDAVVRAEKNPVPSTPLPGIEISELDNKALKSANHHKKCSSVDELSRSHDPYGTPCLECRIPQGNEASTDHMSGMLERIMRKRCASAMDDSLRFFPRHGDNDGLTKIEMIKECSGDKDGELLQVANADKKQETSDTSVADSIPGLDLSPDDVVGVIGQRLFWKARKTIVNQQRTFAMQIFELHRLIKVQRLMAGSPEVLYENNFNLNKPSIKFPPINKLLYVTPLDPSPVVNKPKVEAVNSNPGKDCGQEAVWDKLPPPVNNAEKGHLVHQSTPKPWPTPASFPSAKLAPWCFHPPGNQWLVPVRSPSEGLIYKPYTGPCPPKVGIMAPVYGNCGPISLSPIPGTAYGVPAPGHHEIGPFSGNALSQSYFQPIALPLINARGPNLEVEQTIPFPGAQSAGKDKHSFSFDANFAIPCQRSCSVASQRSRAVSDCGKNLHGSRGSDMQGSSGSGPAEQLQGDALSLFPTTPSSPVSNDRCTEQRVQVIKVVPHNPKSAPESAARIFQSIQEERNKT